MVKGDLCAFSFKIMDKQISWINTGRAICMCCVYFYHSEAFGVENWEYSYFFRPFFLEFFFFISGYLMLVPDKALNVRHKLNSILSKMVWPYWIFTTIIWIPKMIRHGRDIDVASYFVDVFGGTASWFIAALIVAELIILLVSYIIKDTRQYLILGVLTFVAAIVLNKYFPEPQPWYYKSGMMGILFMAMGGCYRYYQNRLEYFFTWKNCMLAFFIYLIIMLADYNTFRYTPSTCAVSYECIPLGLIENIVGICFVLLLVRKIPSCSWFDYIGKNSLPFYFLSGACPTLAVALFKRIMPEAGYLTTFIVAFIAIAMAYMATFIIERYFPIMLNVLYKREKRNCI